MTAMDSVFPMPEGPGADVYFDRWRQMATIFAPPGVVRGVGEQLGAAAWTWDQPDPAVAIASGAVWLGGCYGELVGHKWIGVPGNVGLIVARLVPESSHIELHFKEGPGHGATEDPSGWWEVPLVELTAPGAWHDRRVFTPLEIPPPPVTEMPASTPRGLIAWNGWPATQSDFSGAFDNEIMTWPAGTAGGFESGRNYRFILRMNRQSVQRIAGGGNFAGYITWGVRDDAGDRRRLWMDQASIPNGSWLPANYMSFVLNPTFSNATLYVISNTTATTRFLPWALSMAMLDVGG